MKIDRIILGAYENNSYVVRETAESKDCIIIDTGLSSEELLAFLEREKLSPRYIVLTHGHADHIASVDILRKCFDNIKVAIHKDDSDMLGDNQKNLSIFSGADIRIRPADIIFEDGQDFRFGSLQFKIIHTPGHTAGGICLYNSAENILFSGDTLFNGSVGRTDFNGYDEKKCFEQLISNIKTKLMILPDATKVFAGHGEPTTIGMQRKYNPFLQ